MRLALAVGFVAALVSPSATLAFGADDLVGAWHVLVHYQDSATENPEAKRWEDRIWVFEKVGSQLRWTDYPIVVFDDDTGRFEQIGGNRASRVLDYWEPNAAQQEQIQKGLAINDRGSRSKTLSGSDDKGWSSAKKGAGGYKSSRFITYEETWTIEGFPDKPRFERQDSMGSGGSEDFEGRTLYETTGIAGDVVSGKFDRDGKRKGTFRLARTGSVHSVSEGGGKSQSGEQLKRAEFIAMLTPGLTDPLDGRTEAQWREAVSSSRSKEERLALRAAIEGGLRTQVMADDDFTSGQNRVLSNLAVELERLFADEKKSFADLRKMMQQGEVLTEGSAF